MLETPYSRGRMHFKRTELPLDDYPLVEDEWGGLVPDIPEGTPTDAKSIIYEGFPDPKAPTLWVRCEVEVIDGRLVMHEYVERMTDNTASERTKRRVSPDKIEGAIRRYVADSGDPLLLEWLPVDTQSRYMTRRTKRSDLVVARFAAEWDALIASGDPKPRQTLARRHHRSPETIDNWRKRAADLDFLTSPPRRGVTGSRMTETCREFLEDAGLG